MSPRPAYQLTSHPVGSQREVWALSWPLMLSFCSNSFMYFADRLFLAHYSVAAMNAMAYAANFSFLLLVFPFAISEITEVFVGRFHGAENNVSVGRPTWQMLWFILCLWPLLIAIGQFAPQFLFQPGSLEESYFATFLSFSPFLLFSIALMGFFIGIGKTRTITLVTIVGNLLNILLAPLLIFTCSLGIKGAAIATGASQAVQALILFYLFSRKEMRQKYATDNLKFDLALCKEMLSVGLPSGISRTLEMLAHCFFFVMMAMAGPLELTCASFIQSFFLLIMFCNDGVAKGVTAIISNLVGAKVFQTIRKVLKAAFRVQTINFCVVTCLCFIGLNTIFRYVLQPEEQLLFDNPAFLVRINATLGLMCLFFLLDGIWWILVSHLIALQDTKFIMYVNTIGQWLFYALPTYLMVKYLNAGVVEGWCAIVINACMLCWIFYKRSCWHLDKAFTGDPVHS